VDDARRQIHWRAIVALSVWLAVGCIANLAVTWSLAAFLPQSGWTQRLVFLPPLEVESGSRVTVWEYSTLGAVRRTWEQEDNFVGSRTSPFALAIYPAQSTETDVQTARLSGIHWGNIEAVAEHPEKFSFYGCEHATGWPLLAASYEICMENNTWTYQLRDGIPVQGTAGRQVTEIRGLPYRPLWPGFALNTLFYAAIAWGLWQVPLAIRRRRRRRLNRCMKCGYDRAGLALDAACPECGTKAF
jgi:hypothetical protein